MSGGVMGGIVNGVNWAETWQTSLVSDETADQMLLERTTVDFLTRKGGLKLTKGMTQEEKRTAIRQAVENVVHKEKPASIKEAGEYRAVKPRNVELPTVPIINLSMKDIETLNGGKLPISGNYVRKAAMQEAEIRLGLDKNPAAYIEASNVTRNGDAYILKVTKKSLKKILSASSYSSGIVPLESIAILSKLEQIAQNGVYFKSESDRYQRSQIAGYDHLLTTVYIDNVPFVVDMRVRVSDKEVDNGNTLYHFTPEAIEVFKKR